MSNQTPPNPMSAATFALPGEAGAASAAVTQRILARTRATERKLAPSVALVARALAAAGQPVEGLPAVDGSLGLKSERTVEGLQAAFEANASLMRQVGETLAGYRQATDAMAAAEQALAGGGSTEKQLQALKSAAFFLSRFHEVVKDDPLLAQLFPAPRVLEAGAGDVATPAETSEG